jgi:electron transfer flavoprotein alpha subunit
MADYKGILIIAEHLNGTLASISKELLGAARKLVKDTGEEVGAVLIGDSVLGVSPELVSFGADKVYVVEYPLLKDYRTGPYVSFAENVIKRVNPRIVLAGQTTLGRDVIPALAFRLNTSAVMDCIDLSIETASGKLLQTKPVYGGSAHGIFITETLPNMATIRIKAMDHLKGDPTRKGEIIKFAADLYPSAIRTTVVQKVVQEVQGVKLEDAQIIVSGGRGLGGPEGFKVLEPLVRTLRAAMGASRPPCDNGWVPDKMQVGLTGKIVSPELYLAVGISGSSQHLAGCGGSKNIVAINKDPEANIIKESCFAVVGDYKKVVPALDAKLKELLNR